MIYSILALCFVFVVYRYFRARRSLLPSYIRGPTPPSWILGSQPELIYAEAGKANREWTDTFGTIYRMQTCFGVEWLMINDPNAIQHILQGQTTTYHLEESLREFLRVVTGKGLIYADGPDHARQRRLLQPAFNTNFIKSLTPQFANCASKVVNKWHELINEDKSHAVELNVFHEIERLAMDIIGKTAFGVDFNAVDGGTHELMSAYEGFVNTAYSRPSKFMIAMQALALHLPPFLLAQADKLPLKRTTVLRHAKQNGLRFSKKLIADRKRQNLADPDSKEDSRDMLSVLVKAGEIDERGKMRPMTDEEIYAQLTTFFVAGYETSTNTLSFALYELARNSHAQNQLYNEVFEVIGHLPQTTLADGISQTYFDSMPYLTAVIKETLRLHPAVAYGLFQAGCDDVIPLSKPLPSDGGGEIKAVPIAKGQSVFLSFDGVNRLQEIWGSDANEFKPERWLDGSNSEFSPEKRCGGPYANLCNFGGGPKTCPGWRFAVNELQVIVAYLVRDFEFSLSPKFEMWRDGCFIVTTPTQKGRMDLGPSVPLIIKSRE